MFDWLKKKTTGSAAAESPPPQGTITQAETVPTKAHCDALLAQGRLTEALAGYRALLTTTPKDADLYINIGFVLMEQQQHVAAREALGKALTIDPASADGHYFLGTVLRESGDGAGAISAFERVLSIKPDFTAVHGELARLLCLADRGDEAKTLIRDALRREPYNVELRQYLGNLLATEGAHQEAVAVFREAIARQSDWPGLQSNLGVSLLATGETDAAIACFRAALALEPDKLEFLCNLALGLQTNGDMVGAIAIYRQAIACKPDDAFAADRLARLFQANKNLPAAIDCLQEALRVSPGALSLHVNLGVLLQSQGRLDEALVHAHAAIAIDENSPEAHINAGVALQGLERLDEALACYRKAVEVAPGFVTAHVNLAGVLQEMNRLEEASVAVRQALSIKPDLADTWVQLGGLLQGQGRIAEAVQHLEKALQLTPGFEKAHNNFLYLQSFNALCDRETYLAQARQFNNLFADRAAMPMTTVTPIAAIADAGTVRPLRVGLVSGDLRRHPVGYFLESVLQHVDSKRVSLVAFASFAQEDATTARLKACCSQWHSIVNLDDVEAAHLVRQEQIDLLIDLAGHTAHNRLGVFAYKPAPVQATWLGYWASTGVAAIDYVISDPVSTPPALQAAFTETLWTLPHTRLCFSAPPMAPHVTPLPALRNGFLTFGSFQNASKCSDRTLAVWGRILANAPTAMLRLQAKQLGDESERSRMLRRLADAGIAAERVRMFGPAERADYLRAHGEVDLLLDTWPFPGGTTTCEALWMGVPTLTLAGDTMLSRQGASLLSCVGLSQWIADDAAHYVAKAAALSADLPALASLRAGLREQARRSPLFDAPLFARDLERAFAGMMDAGSRTKQ